MSVDAGLSIRYTNHSLRATSVTRMYNTGVPQKIGHKSLKALRAYERTSTTQQKTVGESLDSGKAFVEKENTPAMGSTPKPSSGFINAHGRETLKTVQQFSGLQNCTFNFYQS